MDEPLETDDVEDADVGDSVAGEVASIGQDWDVVMQMLPAQWESKAVELGAVRRLRGFDSIASLLRVLLIHLADGCSLRRYEPALAGWRRYRTWRCSKGCAAARPGSSGWHARWRQRWPCRWPRKRCCRADGCV